MKDQQRDERSAALRELLVNLPSSTTASRPMRAVSMTRFAVGTATLGVGVSIVALALSMGAGDVPGGALPEPSSPPRAEPSTGIGSRVRMYSSVEELISDSGAVVSGMLVDQKPGPDGTTEWTVEVKRTFTPATLGATAPTSTVTVAEGSTLRVRTFDSMTASVPGAPLDLGSRYLLFLSPTGLPSAGDDEFFITGVSAGVYEVVGDRYVRATDGGDTLPEELHNDDLR
ncbi:MULTISPECIES: hypothetical protein [Microbacterium]|uniref:Uncharacterized protein n=1 Tax=Microbacterium saccharophilum TaxID=1213358 RepID=A0A7Z7D1G2_9MICO|nr:MULTISPECIES: hypothetical protein [Microbacterium]SFI79151.1 hypothetical protein SAMN04487751_2995 [Microbacterium saccharophilum]